MDLLVWYVIIYVFIITIDLIPIYKKENHRVIWFYSIVLLFTFIINSLNVSGYKIPSPAESIKNIVQLIFNI